MELRAELGFRRIVVRHRIEIFFRIRLLERDEPLAELLDEPLFPLGVSILQSVVPVLGRIRPDELEGLDQLGRKLVRDAGRLRIDIEPLQKIRLHLDGREREPVGDVKKGKYPAVREHPLREERLEIHKVRLAIRFPATGKKSKMLPCRMKSRGYWSSTSGSGLWSKGERSWADGMRCAARAPAGSGSACCIQSGFGDLCNRPGG